MTRKKVLIIDDDELHLYKAKELLQNDQIDVVTLKNWLGVTNLVKKLQPDLLLLDINMSALSGDRLASLLL